MVRLAAPRTLELRWADDDWDEPTRMLFRLEEAADATCLTLEHSGREAFSHLFGEELNRAHTSGWSQHLANLAAYSARTSR